LGQVVSAKKYFPVNALYPGVQFEYDFDQIGNRQVAREGGTLQGNGLIETLYHFTKPML